MTRKASKTHHEIVPPAFGSVLLDGHIPDSTQSVWGQLEAAREGLEKAIQLAQASLQANPLTPVLALHLMRKACRRGQPQIVVDPVNGSLILEVCYDLDSSPLPSIGVLREEAKALGIDALPFGKNKISLRRAILDAQEPTSLPASASVPAAKVGSPMQASIKTPPASQPSGESVPNDLSELLASIEASEAEPPPPPTPQVPAPRRGVPKKSKQETAPEHPKQEVVSKPAPVIRPPRSKAPPPARKIGGRSLSDLVQKASTEVDMQALMAKPEEAAPVE